MKSLLFAVLLAAQDAKPAPELPVTYTSPGKGFLSLALYDEQGTLVRTLLSAQAVEAGPGSTTRSRPRLSSMRFAGWWPK